MSDQRGMTDPRRRRFLKLATGATGSAVALSTFPPIIRRALAQAPLRVRGTIEDVRHVVVLMQENRSFDHYFGTLRGVRGFGDRHPIPLASGKAVWFQSDGQTEIGPFHFDTKATSALRTPGTPHTFPDAQAAWAQGRFGHWPRFKNPMSMGYFRREDIPFQFALAEAFTICDAYHCSVTTGTDPNRIVFMSGSNFDPARRLRGENCTDAYAEPVNLRCAVTGKLPAPGYTYHGSAFRWPTLPELLEQAGISWRIYQDPNDNWNGLMHGGLAFGSFREAAAGSSLYRNGMSHWSLEQLEEDVKQGTLPQVSWVLPSRVWSEHPSGSSALEGAEFTARVLDALTARPEVWGRTVVFLTFDENDGLFDHVPPPSPPSVNLDGSLAGKATLDLRGAYFSDPGRKYLHPEDGVSGTVRPWGLGPRVPMYVISPWSRGGWVSSQVFDHTSVGQFLEKRFGISVPAISPWHRAVCGDLTSAFDFAGSHDDGFPTLPQIRNSAAIVGSAAQRPLPRVPASTGDLFQERGMRRSRALPYELHVRASAERRLGIVKLTFRNTGATGAVFHVYDRLHLDRIPRRYTVEAGRSLDDDWRVNDDEGRYDLWVLAPNGFLREFRGSLPAPGAANPEIDLVYGGRERSIRMMAMNSGQLTISLTVRHNAYRDDAPFSIRIPPRQRIVREWSLLASHQWYDFTVAGEGFERRFAGRMETGEPGFSDPAV